MLAMRAYELMVIFDGGLDDSTIQRFLNRMTETIESHGAILAKTDKWGRRKFAYEINHKTEGFYVVLEFVAESGALVDELDRMLRIADEIVRHKTVRLPDSEADRRGLLGGGVPAEAG
jgi:small subunit ribosomal protein S6